LIELRDWFSQNLDKPAQFERSRHSRGEGTGVCWFKSSATEHIPRIYEMSCILKQNLVHVRVFKTRHPGYIVYEDEYQVVAEPFADLEL
jgi:hypothetical protein